MAMHLLLLRQQIADLALDPVQLADMADRPVRLAGLALDLRNLPEGGAEPDDTVLAQLERALQIGMRLDATVIADSHVRTDHGAGAHGHVVAEDGPRIDVSGGVNRVRDARTRRGRRGQAIGIKKKTKK